MSDIFNIENFNIISDNENYYFFRALSNGDNNDIEQNITTDITGQIKRVRTDRERYGEDAIYRKDSKLSLEEIYNHIKIHHRIDTNCISLTSNSNVGIMYGREYYKDKYIIVKVPKKELGQKVVHAAKYMFEEIEKVINKLISEDKIDEKTIELLKRIEACTSQEELDLLVNKKESHKKSQFKGGIEFNLTESTDYNALSPEQNLYKNIIIAKIDLINQNIIDNVSNKKLIETLGCAISSLELTHYNDIKRNEIIEISKEIMDIFSAVQQLPKDFPNRNSIIEELLNYIENNPQNINVFKYSKSNLDEDDYSIDKIYNISQGEIEYNTASSIYKKLFYLSKSKLRTIHIVNQLKMITNNNPQYDELFKYLLKNSYGVEPKIFTRRSVKKVSISESLSLDINSQERELLETFNYLSEIDLEYIVQNPEILRILLPKLLYAEENSKDRNTYYANAIVDSFDWSRLNITKIYDEQKNEIITKLKECNCYEIYNQLKQRNIKEKDIANVLLTMVIKNKNINEITINESFTVEELEDFLDYYQIKGTKLKLKKYQATAINNIDKIFEEKNFCAAVLPTGAGKSFISIARMLENRDAKMLYLAPNVEILNQLKSYIRKYVYGTKNTTGLSNDEVLKRVFPNLTLSTYAYLKEDNAKAIRGTKYDLIIFDEIHRTGATEWSKYVKETVDHQKDTVKVLGISATPQRDMDLNNMADIWANYFGYTEDEIDSEKHLAMNMDIIDGINYGHIVNPRIINCEYSLKNSEQLEIMKYQIDNLQDEKLQKELKEKYEKLRRNIDKSSGIEKILSDYLKNDGKYIVFIPVTKKDDGEYEDEDGNSIDKSKAEKIIQAYKNQMQQYIFAGKFIEENKEVFIELEECLENNIEFNSNIIYWLNNNKETIQSLTRINMLKNNTMLVSKINGLSEEIIKRMNWVVLNDQEKGEILQRNTKKYIETYSMSSSYSDNKNKKELNSFNSTNNSKKLKLMLVMNKLNEGVHVDKIEGIIWLRPMDENSKILYLQQLGRCIYPLKQNKNIPDDERPTVIDLVNNSLTVNLEKGELPESRDLNILRLISSYIEQQGNFLNSIEKNNQEEILYLIQLSKIKNKYSKYTTSNMLEKLDYKRKKLIESIIFEGDKIDLWNIDFMEYKKLERNNKTHNKTNNILNSFEIKGKIRDFVELENRIRETIKPLTRGERTKEILEYLEGEDNKTGNKHILRDLTPERLSNGIIMGKYYTREKLEVRELELKKKKNEPLTQEDLDRIEFFGRIEEKNKKNQYFNDRKERERKTKEILYYLDGEDNETGYKHILTNRTPERLSNGTTMGSYYIREKPEVCKLELKKKKNEPLTQEDLDRIEFFGRIEEKNKKNQYFNDRKERERITKEILDYLDGEDNETGYKHILTCRTPERFSDGTIMGTYYKYEKRVVRELELKKKNNEPLTQGDLDRIEFFGRIEEKNKKNQYFNDRKERERITKEILDYLEGEDNKTGYKHILTNRTPERLSNGTTMGSYYIREKPEVCKLELKKKKNEPLTQEDLDRIEFFGRIEEKNKKNQYFNDRKERERITKEILDYLDGEDNETGYKHILIAPTPERLSNGTIMGNYYLREKQVVCELELKKKKNEPLTQEDLDRIEFFGRIEEKNKKNQYFNDRKERERRTKEILDYLDGEDNKTGNKHILTCRTPERFSDGTIMGNYYLHEKRVVRELELKRKNNEPLTQGDLDRIEFFGRIEEKNQKNQCFNDRKERERRTKEILDYLEGEDNKTGYKHILTTRTPETLSNGTIMGNYYIREKLEVRKLELKKKNSEPLTQGDLDRIELFKDIEFYNGLNHLKEYLMVHGNLNVNPEYRGRSNFKLLDFLNGLRNDYYLKDKSERQLKREDIMFKLYPNWINPRRDELNDMLTSDESDYDTSSVNSI